MSFDKLRLNTVILIGEVVSVECRSKPGSNKVVNVINMTIDDSYLSSDGQLVSRNVPVEVTYFKALPPIKEGTYMVISGKLSFSQWIAKDGSPRHRLGVVAVEQPKVITLAEGQAEDKTEMIEETYADDIPF